MLSSGFQNKTFVPSVELYGKFCRGWNLKMISDLQSRRTLEDKKLKEGEIFMINSGVTGSNSNYTSLMAMVVHQYGYVSVVDRTPEVDRIDSFFYPFEKDTIDQIRMSVIEGISAMDIILSWFETSVVNKMMNELKGFDLKNNYKEDIKMSDKVELIKVLMTQANLLVNRKFFYSNIDILDYLPGFQKNSFDIVCKTIYEKLDNLRVHHKDYLEKSYNPHLNIFGKKELMFKIDEITDFKNELSVNEIKTLMLGFQSIIKNEV